MGYIYTYRTYGLFNCYQIEIVLMHSEEEECASFIKLKITKQNTCKEINTISIKSDS